MLQMFYLDIVYVCNGFQVFSGVFDTCFMFAMVFKCFQMFLTYVSSVSSIFGRISQVLYLDILNVDRVLHKWQCDSSAVAARVGVRGRAGHRHRLV